VYGDDQTTGGGKSVDSTACSRTREMMMKLCQARHDPLTLRQEMADLLRRAVPFDAWCWGYADPGNRLVSSGTGTSPACADISRALAFEYRRDSGLPAEFTLASFAEGDDGPHVGVLSHATASDLHRSARWREFYAPHAVGDELRAALVADKYCWGYLELLREFGPRRFTFEEAQFVARLGASMARAIRTALTRIGSPVIDVTGGAGTLIYDIRDNLLASTPEGEHWLAVLRARDSPVETLFPAPVPILALSAYLRAASGDQLRHARIRTRTPTGGWLTIQVSPLTGATTPPGTIAVTIQPARPAEIAPLIFHAHGLTPRERQLANLLLEGLPNSEMAKRLLISHHTVQDHVKAVLTKLDVHSKRELVASILGKHPEQLEPCLKV
jgi:DNA-binding CsgD family transcriptional regulator